MTMIEARFHKTQGDFALDVDLSLPGRGVSALFGTSGSGKTTLLRCIAGLERPHSGRLVVNGETWQDSEQKNWLPPHQRAIGYVFQEANLFPHLTVRANLDYGWKRIAATERRVQIDDVVNLLGLESLLTRYPAGLSGGERQRVAIARALLTSPRLILMDEPLSALDDAGKHEILPYLERLHHELSVPMLYVSHAVREVARLADYLVTLKGGRVVSHGPLIEQMARLDATFVADAEHGSVIEGRVAGHDDEDHLTLLEFSGGKLMVGQQPLPLGQPVRVYIPAADVSLALIKQQHTSILNILPARIEEIVPQGESQLLVRLALGQGADRVPLLARITRKSGRQLALQPGLNVYAQIKSVSLMRAQG